jgi:V/A-type H+-transporting ATPase subunit E
MKTKAESEIKLSGTQAVSAIKNKIVTLVTAKVIDDAATKALSDAGALKEFISAVVSNWKASAGEAPNLEVLLPAAKQEEFEKAGLAGASSTLSAGLTVTFSKDVKAGFKIGPADGSFKVSLTDADFQEFFKEYLRPKTRAYLFGE